MGKVGNMNKDITGHKINGTGSKDYCLLDLDLEDFFVPPVPLELSLRLGLELLEELSELPFLVQ